jgi:hypothetical protein
MYNSQQGEDKFLYDNFLNYKNGFFIELGAMDGIIYSNSYFFEKSLDWTGILIEPTVDVSVLNRNRPMCYNFSCAISKNEGMVEFVGDGALGGITSSMPDGHYFGWDLDKKSKYFVFGRPIRDIIYEVDKLKKIEKIDFLSLDVEGGELEVLMTYPFEIPTYVVLIEMTNYDIEKNEKCRNILRTNGFEYNSVIGCNEIWINNKNK